MKKVLFVMMCCIAVVFCSCHKENANESFIGTYTGNTAAKLNVTMTQVPGNMSQDFSENYYVTLIISAGSESNQVVATCFFEDNTYNLTGTVDGNNVDFDPVSFDYNTSAMQSAVDVNASLDLNGTLVSTGLNLEGVITGSGTVTIPIGVGEVNSQVNITGTTNGLLTKIVGE